MSKCDNCRLRKESAKAFDIHWLGEDDCPYDKCPVPPLKKTNADRIRGMTDEELCAFLCDITDCPVCPGADACEDGCGWDREKKVMKGLYAWLKQEATDGQ